MKKKSVLNEHKRSYKVTIDNNINNNINKKFNL